MPTSSTQQNKPSHNEIAQVARTLWQQAGQPRDRDVEFWLTAEQRLAAPVPASANVKTPAQQPKAAAAKTQAFSEPKSRRRETQAA